MSVRSFGSKSGTHRVLFEQMTSDGKTDCTVALRRPKIAKFHIQLAMFGERPKSDPGHADRGEMGPTTGPFCKTAQNEIL